LIRIFLSHPFKGKMVRPFTSDKPNISPLLFSIKNLERERERESYEVISKEMRNRFYGFQMV